ncbi:hypothetical protein BDF14DRAFT_1824085 [Spinellus fusiger]|nr:hypothetical protein BDF14DRAFT_1824085 [Spinellus fusiger]
MRGNTNIHSHSHSHNHSHSSPSSSTTHTNNNNNNNNNNNSSSNSRQSLDSLIQLTTHLQAQVEQLQKSQTDMELKMQTMQTAAQQMAEEIAQLKKTMAEKENLIKQREKELETAQHTVNVSHAHQEMSLRYASNHSNSSNSNSNTPTMEYKQAWSIKTRDGSLQPPSSPSHSPSIRPALSTLLGSAVGSAVGSTLGPPIPLVHVASISSPSASSSSSISSPSSVSSVIASSSMITSPLETILTTTKMPERLAFLTLGKYASAEKDKDASTSDTHLTSLTRTKTHRNKGKSKSPDWRVSPHVLLVDDDSVYRDISKKLLTMIGCTTDMAQDGLEALRKMGLEKYDLILMDIMMPHLDGISATRNIRQYDAVTPIISMTSNFNDDDIMQYIGSGMTDILPKPFSKNTLYSLLEKYCAHLKTIQKGQGQEEEKHEGVVSSTGDCASTNASTNKSTSTSTNASTNKSTSTSTNASTNTSTSTGATTGSLPSPTVASAPTAPTVSLPPPLPSLPPPPAAIHTTTSTPTPTIASTRTNTQRGWTTQLQRQLSSSSRQENKREWTMLTETGILYEATELPPKRMKEDI